MLEETLTRLLQQIYPERDPDDLAKQVVEAFWPTDKQPQASRRDSGNSMWSQNDSILITYGDSLLDDQHKPLDILGNFLQEQLRGLINSVHILPFFPYTSDDGFSVSDYTAVNPQLGDWDDIQSIAGNFTLMSDLVLNHVSSQGVWFNAYLQGQKPYDEFFTEASPDDDLSATVRPRSTPLLREVETSRGKRHVWCTFSHDQVDLNFKNPEVLLEIVRIVRLHVDMGVRILRLDAVAFIWKEPGTSSIHLPQTHAIIKLLRALVDYAEEDIILLTETNVPKAENLSYFGQADEAHMIYNFPLPPLILHGLQAGTATFLNRWQASMPPAPMGCTYLNFSASHDGVGMRPVEGLLPTSEVEQLVQTVKKIGGKASMRMLEDGTEAIYELNCTYFDALSQTFDGPDEHHVARFLASQMIVMSLEGIPAFYIHSLLATANDLDGAAKRKMNRAINRYRWDYPTLHNRLADPESMQSRVLAALAQRLQLRSQQPAFHPNATQFTLKLDDCIFGIWRQSLDRSQSIFALHNVSKVPVQASCSALNLIADEHWVDILTDESISEEQKDITLTPYQCRWITNRVQMQ